MRHRAPSASVRALVAVLLVFLVGEPAVAASAAWGAPRVVWESQGRVSNPKLVTDAYGQPHLFFLEDVDGREGPQRSVLMQLAVDDSSALPIDVAVNIQSFRPLADSEGRIHIMDHGEGNALYVRSVDAREAGNAGAWSAPHQVSTAIQVGDLTATTAGILHGCFAQPQRVLHSVSLDGGQTWDSESVVAYMQAGDGQASDIRCIVEPNGAIHVAWSEVVPPNFYPSTGLFLATSRDGGTNWDRAEQMAGEHYGLPTLLVDLAGGLNLFWNGDVSVGGRYFRRRLPDGDWAAEETVLPTGNGGFSGDAGLALDSTGTLHATFAANEGIRWATRAAGAWTEPVTLSTLVDPPPNITGSVEQPTMTVARGNELYAAWESDFRLIYVAEAIADAPPVEPPPPEDQTVVIAPPSPGHEAQRTPSGQEAPQRQQIEASDEPPTSTPIIDLETLGQTRSKRMLPVVIATALSFIIIVVAVLRHRRSVHA